ncbi:flagellin [Desulfobulbus alkaliphilus]|uniref:flagellin n=1 Tax=Desulfobulbus alkaliphilus TaxID=869814 RepID=UPI0019657A1E|nr:flagellin [Desulfobulbus alkaliphilus]MBM9537399.1 flagellin [Desulfobulbus alkaliphilus]
MALTINTNVASLNAQRNLGRSQGDLATSMERLSSGLRINSAKDDAAGLAISNRMTSQIRGLNQAARNANDGISLSQTAEGAMQESTNILQRIRELAVQAANATNSAADRAALQAEVNQLKTEMNRIAQSTTFNGLKILDGTFVAQQFQVGPNANETIGVSIKSMSADDLGRYTLDAPDAVNTQPNAGTGSVTVPAATLPDPITNTVPAQDLTINGSRGAADIPIEANATAWDIATQITNNASKTGVTATARTTVTLGNLVPDGIVSMTIGSGGNTATVNAAVSATDMGNLAAVINDQSGATGVVAYLEGSSLQLVQAEGKNIEISGFTHSDGAGVIQITGTDTNPATLDNTNGSTVATGTVELSSQDSYTATSSVSAADGSVFNNLAAGDTVIAILEEVTAIDISDILGANDALKIVDAALGKIDAQRGDLGALQNRFESTIANLQNVAENLTAARSRIRDADIAQETSEMTKNNILQQAGVSILTQANQTPQLALQLLQG